MTEKCLQRQIRNLRRTQTLIQIAKRYGVTYGDIQRIEKNGSLVAQPFSIAFMARRR